MTPYHAVSDVWHAASHVTCMNVCVCVSDVPRARSWVMRGKGYGKELLVCAEVCGNRSAQQCMRVQHRLRAQEFAGKGVCACA